MDSNRDARKPQATTTPVFGGASRSVYRSLAAAPSAAPFSVYRDPAGVLERPSKLLGPQTKGPGDVVWAEQKVQKSHSAELLPCPIPLIVAHAPHQSVFVESNPVTKVVSAVHGLFQQHQVDTTYNAEKFKWKCLCYAAEGVETRFVARLFSVPEKAGFFVLDFQRRCGDAFYFQSLYKAMHFRLLKTGFVVCNDSKSEQMRAEEPVIRTFKPLPLPSDLLGQVDESEQLDFTPIFRMCNSQYIDVQREGLAALASQLAEADERSQTTALPIIERLTELLSLTRDAQVRRLAVTALAGLSVLPQSHEKLCEKAAVLLLVKLTLNAEEVVETRRKACQVLTQLPRRVFDESSLGALRAAQNCADVRLAQLIQSVVV